jgi:hypothetical protein
MLSVTYTSFPPTGQMDRVIGYQAPFTLQNGATDFAIVSAKQDASELQP